MLPNLSYKLRIKQSKLSAGIMMIISEADIEQFEQDGAIVLRNVFSDDWVQKVQEGIQVKWVRRNETFHVSLYKD